MSAPNAGRRGHRWQRVLRPAVLAQAGGICAICRQRACPTCGALACGGRTPPGQVDHVVPVTARPDLAEHLGNLRAAHGHCNRQRSTTSTTTRPSRW